MKKASSLLESVKCSKCFRIVKSEFQHGGYVEYYAEGNKIYCKRCADQIEVTK